MQRNFREQTTGVSFDVPSRITLNTIHHAESVGRVVEDQLARAHGVEIPMKEGVEHTLSQK